MRILNKRQIAGLPMSDQGNLYLGEIPEAVESRREQLRLQNLREQQRQKQMRARQAAAQAQESKMRERMAMGHAAMLNRSLRQNGRKQVHAAMNQGQGFVPKFGITNPLLGFVDETTEPNFSQSEVYPAQEFNNILTAKNNKNYAKNKDYPLVIDAPKGDFGGILVNEASSPDFSTRIVNDVKTDFGYVPMRRRKRR